jgi:DNA primase
LTQIIPEEVISDIRQRADIVAIISRHVQLKKAGRNHKGVCPFHGDKDPSFNVSPDKGFFYCFGCQKKGDVFTFIMELEGKSFAEAAETLAELTGVSLPTQAARSPTGEPRNQRNPRTDMLKVNALAMRFFEETMKTPAGAAARAYLDKRGISEAIATAFHLGAAPNAWSGLYDHFVQQQAPISMAESLGLIARRQRGPGFYDRYRDRIVCPVMNVTGDVVGFSARRLADGDAETPKYINSSESALYKKSKLLFGLYQARQSMRQKDRAILVEGNFDVISLHQAGFTETIAPLGTALTPEQAGLLERLVKRVVLLYDGDRAGLAATFKAVKVLLSTDLEVRVALMPEGQDPDSFVHGGGDLGKLIDLAQPGIEYGLKLVWSGADQTADGKAKALAQAAEFLRAIRNETARDLAFGQFANRLNITRSELDRALRRANTGERNSVLETKSVSRPAAPPPRRELEAIAFLADHPNLLSLAHELNLFSYLTDQRLRDMYSAARNGVPLLSAVPDDPQLFSHILSGAHAAIEKPEATLREIVAVLAKDKSLSHLTQSRPGLAPDEERKRLHEIVNTRRQVE